MPDGKKCAWRRSIAARRRGVKRGAEPRPIGACRKAPWKPRLRRRERAVRSERGDEDEGDETGAEMPRIEIRGDSEVSRSAARKT